MNKRLAAAVVFAIGGLVACDAQALGKVSRACSFSTWRISFPVVPGTTPWPPYDDQYWSIFESLTVDWQESRFWLVASAAVYQFVHPNGGYALWNIYPTERVMGNWRNTFRARSGTGYVPNILYILNGFVYTGPGTSFKVIGKHWAAPPTSTLISMGESVATDCNLTQWGLEFQAGW